MRDETTVPVQDLASLDLYEPPRVESVMTPEELAREIQYAGIGSGGPVG